MMAMKITHGVMVGLLAMLTGCVTTPMHNRVQKAVVANRTTAEADLTGITENEGYFMAMDGPWLSGEQIAVATMTKPQPAWLTQSAALGPQYPVTLQKIAELIVQGYGIKVDVMADATDIASKVIDPTAALRGGEQGQQTASQTGTIWLDYHGQMAGLLDHVASRVGVSWRVMGDGVQIYYRDTRTFEVHAAPGQNTISNTVSNASGGRSGGGGSSQNGGSVAQSAQTISTQATLDIFATIAESLKTALSTGDAFVASPALGTVTVTATPSTLDRVADMMLAMNARMTRQVAIEAKLVSVTMKHGSNYGIDWNLLYTKLGSYGVSASSFGEAGLTDNSLSVAVLDSSSRYNGSTAVINALSSQGNVSVENTVPAITMSSQPVTVQFTDSQPYISRVETTLATNVGSQTSVETSDVVTGMAVHLLPVVTDEQDVLLQLQVTLSNVTAFRKLAVPGGTTQLEIPAVASRDIAQRLKLRPGQTLVVAGFEQLTNGRDSRGIGSPNAWLLGGNANANEERVILVLLVTPKIL